MNKKLNQSALSQHSAFTQVLLEWYHENARKLPWRETSDPYAIWVSEVMLQQTQVETVIPYYHRFLRQFPTVAALAAAPEEDVLKAWEGLGYYRRARLLIQGVREVFNRFDGKLPSDPQELSTIPGIGPYMTGSITSIAFDKPVPAVDGNVIRFVTRILAWEEDAGTARSKRMITDWVRERFPKENTGDFTQALMEIGALVCTPRNPCCPVCPVSRYCRSFGSDPERFPIKKAPPEVPSERRIVLMISWQGKRLLGRRPENGLMAGFWEYPSIVAEKNEDAVSVAERWSKENLGKTLDFHFFKKMTHGYSHLCWNLEILTAEMNAGGVPAEMSGYRWFSAEEEAKLPRVAFVRKLGAKPDDKRPPD